jgi:3-oxoacyl-(acyl-carrier-protein) synthase
MRRRVVITGLGVVAPNATGVPAFDAALRATQSGLRTVDFMVKHGFACTVGGIPQGVDELAKKLFTEEELIAMNAIHRYAAVAAVEAWEDAGLARPKFGDETVHWDTGAVLGTGIGGMDTVGELVVKLVNENKVRRLGSTAVEQVMASGLSARVSGILALGNQVTTNSSACATGAEAIAMGAQRIRAGLAERMVCGGAEVPTPYNWAGFDAMRVLNRKHNETPEAASRPMSASAGGFIPGAGAGALVVESLDAARARGARIHAEVLGEATNCGGHRGGGSMTAPNPEGVRRCIQLAVADAGIAASEVDAISGHLTATGADPREVGSWSAALGRGPESFPWITSTKSLVGHTLGAAGAIESVAAVLMLRGGYVHGSKNCEDVHPEIAPFAASIPHEMKPLPSLRTIMKAGFGFGDVNAALVLRKWSA